MTEEDDLQYCKNIFELSLGLLTANDELELTYAKRTFRLPNQPPDEGRTKFSGRPDRDLN